MERQAKTAENKPEKVKIELTKEQSQNLLTFAQVGADAVSKQYGPNQYRERAQAAVAAADTLDALASQITEEPTDDGDDTSDS